MKGNTTIVGIIVVLVLLVGAYLIFRDEPVDTGNSDTARTQDESNLLANPLQAAEGVDTDSGTLTDEEQDQADMIQAEGK